MMPQFDEFNPFSSTPADTNVLTFRREKEKEEKTRTEVKAAILTKCRQIGPIQLPLPNVRRKSA